MKNHIILLLVGTTLILGSCELIDPFINPPKDACILQKTSWSIPNDPAHEDTEFLYDSSDKLIEVKKTSYDMGTTPDIARWTITYSNDKLDKLTSYYKFQGDQEEKIGEWLFQYSGNLPDTIKSPAANSSTNSLYYVAHYNSDKLVSLETYTLDLNGSSYSLFNKDDLEWTGENISKMTITNKYGSTRSYEYEYDDKKAPLGHLGLAVSSYGSLTMLSKNNVTKTTYYFGTDVYVFETSYTYNATGYPISATPLEGATINYEYDCK